MHELLRGFLLKFLDRLLPPAKLLGDRHASPAISEAPSQPPPYRVFTREFDKVVDADDLDAILGALPPEKAAAFEEAKEAFFVAMQGWRIKVLAKNLAAIARIKRTMSDAERADTVISILIDHSGSMRGHKILLTAASVQIIVELLLPLGIWIEVLGFTTQSWKGGKSREKWLQAGRPPEPGRLCDLLHIVYASGKEWHTQPSFSRMLREDQLKENIDGEAIEWAAERLRARPESRKILVVVSDGAPVDDSTLTHNKKNSGILLRHLRDVVADIEASDDIEIAAIGIDYDPRRYYYDAVTIEAPEDLGDALIGLVEEVLSGARLKIYSHWTRRTAARMKKKPNVPNRARLPRSHG